MTHDLKPFQTDNIGKMTRVDGHVKLSQKWSFKTEPLGN